MILSDRDIQKAIKRKELKIIPEPPEHLWTSTAVDLRLDGKVRRWTTTDSHGLDARITPADRNFNFTELVSKNSELIQIPSTGIEIKKGEFILGWTMEKVQLPHKSKIAARVEGKSSLARLGLGVHVTAPTIHAGFGYDKSAPNTGNTIQLEMWNIGPLPILLVAEMPICQLIFERVSSVPKQGYRGQFAKQTKAN